MTKESKVYKGAVTTEPEFSQLIEAIGEPKKGDRWSHEMIAGIISVPYGTERYRTIVDRWRNKVERDYPLVIGSIPGFGYVCLDDLGASNFSEKKIKTASNALKKGVRALATIERANLPESEKSIYDFRVSRAAKLQAAFSNERRARLPEKRANAAD